MTLDVDAVEAFSRGRLDRDDPDAQRQLDAALAAARQYCGWHVTPVLEDASVTIDGNGGSVIFLPTLMVTELTAVTEDDISLDLADLNWSAGGRLVKRSGCRWSAGYSAITVTMSHGYASAADFESVVLGVIERGAFSADRTARVIGPFQFTDDSGSGMFIGPELSVLNKYRLERLP